MKIATEIYSESIDPQPKSGQHILGHQDGNLIVVYQAYKNSIANFAVTNQCLGGPDYSYKRMSWIKPNFLWMMYRCGWAEKENQEKVLAIWVEKTDFETILNEAVLSSFDSKYYIDHEHWKRELNTKEVRIQWDPDHDPYGHKMERRAIQVGLKGKILENFGKQQIKRIEDITDFVKLQKKSVDKKQLDKLLVPFETIFKPASIHLAEKIGID
jgi:hypothetical protein